MDCSCVLSKKYFFTGRHDRDLANVGERDHWVEVHRTNQSISGGNVSQCSFHSQQKKGDVINKPPLICLRKYLITGKRMSCQSTLDAVIIKIFIQWWFKYRTPGIILLVRFWMAIWSCDKSDHLKIKPKSPDFKWYLKKISFIFHTICSFLHQPTAVGRYQRKKSENPDNFRKSKNFRAPS